MDETEPILLENDWANWHQFGGRRYAVIINEYLIGASRPNSVDNLYNSLSVQSTFTQLEESYIYKFKQILQKNNLVSNYSIDLSIWARLAYAQMYSGQWYSVPAMQDLDSLLKQYPKDSKLLSWRAMLALEFQDWHKLKQLAKNYKKSDWLLIAEKNIEGKSKVESQCLSLFFQKNYREKIFKLNCSDKSLRLLYAWIKGPHSGKEQAREEFLKSYHSIVLNQWLEHLNYSSGLMWDIHIESYMQPTNIDLILNSKDFRYYKNIVQRRLSPISQSEN